MAWNDVPAPARWLGLAGLIPFAAGAVGVHVIAGGVAEALTVYAAVILSFMGGCRWGLAAAGLGTGPTLFALTTAVVPSLYAWAAALTAPWPLQPLLLAIGFVSLYVADVALTRRGGAPAWWPSLRLPLTAGATAALLVAALARPRFGAGLVIAG